MLRSVSITLQNPLQFQHETRSYRFNSMCFKRVMNMAHRIPIILLFHSQYRKQVDIIMNIPESNIQAYTIQVIRWCITCVPCCHNGWHPVCLCIQQPPTGLLYRSSSWTSEYIGLLKVFCSVLCIGLLYVFSLIFCRYSAWTSVSCLVSYRSSSCFSVALRSGLLLVICLVLYRSLGYT